jgi:hypothetical protein
MSPATTVAYGTAWLQAFLTRGTGLVFDTAQVTQVTALAEQSLLGLFDVATQTALANGRSIIERQDLPLTRGLRARLGEAESLAGEVALQPLLTFLAEAGVPGPLDERVRMEVPRLMAALLLLAGQVISLLEPSDVSTTERLERLLRAHPSGPTHWELERAARVLKLTV